MKLIHPGEHDVNIGSRVIYLTTGTAPEGDQWPKA